MKNFTAEQIVDIMYKQQDQTKFKELKPDLNVLLYLLEGKTIGIINVFESEAEAYFNADRYFVYDAETGKTFAIIHQDHDMNAMSIVFYDEGNDDIDIYLLDPDEAEEVM